MTIGDALHTRAATTSNGFIASHPLLSLTACAVILAPASTSLAAALWVIVAAIAMRNGRHLWRHPGPRPVV